MKNLEDSASRPLDIALLTPTLDGGVGRVFLLLAKGFKKRGFSVAIWTIAGGAYAKEAEKSVPVEYLNVERARKIIKPLIKFLKEKKPEVVLAASFHINCIAVLSKIFSRSKSKLFLAEHTSLDAAFKTLLFHKSFVAKALVRSLYKKTDGLIAVSKGVAESVARYAKIPNDSVKVVYNPVITEEMMKLSQESVTHPFFDQTEPVMLAVGRLSSEKDYPTLIEAFKKVNQIKKAKLIIVGDGPEKSEIENKIHNLKLSDRVSLIGSSENPYPYFKKSNLYILSSIREGLPTTLIEALALKTPIVSTDAPSGPREILRDGKYGKLVPVKNVAALADAILETVNSDKINIPDEAIAPYKTEAAVENYLKILFPEK